MLDREIHHEGVGGVRQRHHARIEHGHDEHPEAAGAVGPHAHGLHDLREHLAALYRPPPSAPAPAFP